ncbi:MAG: PAS domain-containing protein [Proteobacteria bacterium]|nr:PAS domain-containing protein [Pseudomonadota bacterium]
MKNLGASRTGENRLYTARHLGDDWPPTPPAGLSERNEAERGDMDLRDTGSPNPLAEDFSALLSRHRPSSGARRGRLNLSIGRVTSPEGSRPDTLFSLYQGVMDQAPPIYVADFGGNLLYSNKAFAEIAPALFGLADGVEWPGETAPGLMKIIERLYLDMRTVEIKDTVEIGGESRNYASRHFPIHDEDGELLGFGGLYADVSQQNRAALRAEQMESWLQDVVRSASDWVWEIDANFNLTFVSPRISEALGLPPQLLKGKHLFSLGQFEDDPESAHTGKEIMDRQSAFRHRVFLMPDDQGRTRRIHLSGVPVFDETGGKFVGYRGTGTDFTRQYEAEQSASQAKSELEKTLEILRQQNVQLDLALGKAQVANKAKMDFLAMMSHELRTPLNAIIGFSEVASQKVFGPLNDTYLGYFDDILNAGRHLLTIINDILDTANIEKQELSVEVSPVRARELIQESRALVALRAEEKGLDITGVDIEDDWSLLVDRVRARQIFVNLLGNSVKFTPKDGKIGVETRETADGKLALTVWDSGIGIPAEEQDHVFEHFYQVENNILSRRDQGTGLGLSVSLYLARLMGGDITLESEDDNGARFTVTLPLAKPVIPVPSKD